MKATLYSSDGKKKSQIDLPKIFDTRIREDIVLKCFEAEKLIQPYASDELAGLKQSASGTISHKRHDWKGHYGRGISRVPRKTMWRRGTQFHWVGANIPGSRGGRRAHPPKGIGKEKKINKKEMKLAFNSALASTAKTDLVISRYDTINKIDNIPAVMEFLPKKIKDMVLALTTIFGENAHLAFRKKSVRAGKGKLRGRKYKSTAGVLIITSSKENQKFNGIDVVSIPNISISDLYPLGRLTVYTKSAIEEITVSKKKIVKKEKSLKKKVKKQKIKIKNSKTKIIKEKIK